VYAATDAARLHRLNQKLIQVTKKDSDVDYAVEETEEDMQDVPGWCWFTTFGLLDPDNITPERLQSLSQGSSLL